MEVPVLIVLCEEFAWERQELWGRRGDIEGSDVWLEEFTEEDNLGKQQCCWIGCL